MPQLRDPGTARERLLAAADELFYGEGVHSVGIDRVIERAGVAKATLYSTFGSKDGLIRSYLDGRHRSVRERVLAAVERRDDPRERLLAVFEVQAERVAEPGYRGCAFVNASAESPRGGVVEQASDEMRAWLRALLVQLSSDAGAPDPEGLARQLVLLYDGAAIGGRMDHDPTAAATARAAAGAVIDAALRVTEATR
ncbi:MAG TPA: TetR/AcrR family transcriptional regulator [Gaiellales bacterium]|jgi:AcrR family transcriptional regulator